MKESGYYPAGAEYDPTSPWNKRYQSRPISFECEITETLVKKAQVPTFCYSELYEQDEDGYPIHEVTVDEDVDWENEYQENCITVCELIDLLKTYVKKDLASTDKNSLLGKHLQDVLNACDGWSNEEIIVDKL